MAGTPPADAVHDTEKTKNGAYHHESADDRNLSITSSNEKRRNDLEQNELARLPIEQGGYDVTMKTWAVVMVSRT